ncbi:MAG: low affinity iron permease family protein [Dehalococcoidia bacterium]
MNDLFRVFSRATSHWMGTTWAFLAATSVVLVWAALGPLAGFSSTWQLVINTGTTIVTFLMVFLIQNTQNRDSAALHLKLDELISALHGARSEFLDLENADDDEVKAHQDEFAVLKERVDSHIQSVEKPEPPTVAAR